MPDLYGPLCSLRDSLTKLHDRVIAEDDIDRAYTVTRARLRVNTLVQGNTDTGTDTQVDRLRELTDRAAALKKLGHAKFDALFEELESFLATL